MTGSARTAIQADIEHVRQHLDVLGERLGPGEAYLSAVLLKHLATATKRLRECIGL